MAARKIKEDVYAVGAIDWDRTLFDEIIPLPDGTSYNSYLVVGTEKTALIDTVEPEKSEELFSNLEELNVQRIDYVVSNHAEQDHSGTIPKILEMYPMAKVVTNEKCKGFEKDLLMIEEEKFITIEDGETLSLGNKTLKFIFTPWVHWPETMSTYLVEDKILFTCDFFGSHIASSDLFVKNNAKAIEDAKRYYAEIMMPFRRSIRSNLKKLEPYDVDFIAPSHGQVYDHPEIILDSYKEWASDKVKSKVVIPYVSMHGSTKKIVEHFVSELMKRGIEVRPYNVITADIGEIAMSLVDAATIVVASPTVLVGLHPTAAYVLSFINAIRPKVKFGTFIGSYGWAGQCVNQAKALTSNLKVEMLEPVLIKGYPKVEDFKKLDDLAEEISNKHKNCEYVKF
jgi:flavorubredoxin